MGIKTGNPRGRPRGSRNRKTEEKIAKIEASGITPLDYMLEILRDNTRDFDQRFEAAKAAAPFVHARLSSIEADVNFSGHEAALSELE